MRGALLALGLLALASCTSQDRAGITVVTTNGVSARVVDSLGAPVQHLQILALPLPPSAPAGNQHWDTLRTDSTGSADLSTLAPGIYRLWAQSSTNMAQNDIEIPAVQDTTLVLCTLQLRSPQFAQIPLPPVADSPQVYSRSVGLLGQPSPLFQLDSVRSAVLNFAQPIANGRYAVVLRDSTSAGLLYTLPLTWDPRVNSANVTSAGIILEDFQHPVPTWNLMGLPITLSWDMRQSNTNNTLTSRDGAFSFTLQDGSNPLVLPTLRFSATVDMSTLDSLSFRYSSTSPLQFEINGPIAGSSSNLQEFSLDLPVQESLATIVLSIEQLDSVLALTGTLPENFWNAVERLQWEFRTPGSHEFQLADIRLYGLRSPRFNLFTPQ